MVRDKKTKKFKNVSVFTEEADRFESVGYYCSYPKKTKNYNTYWKEQRRRCREGYEVDGVKITGDHYFYLNFFRILVLKYDDNGEPTEEKEENFPEFWDGDYTYFWCRNIARFGVLKAVLSKEDYDIAKKLSEEKKEKLKKKLMDQLGLLVELPDDQMNGSLDMVVGKSRRKGYSYKASAICCNNFHNFLKRKSIVTAYAESTLKENMLVFIQEGLEFLSKHTCWSLAKQGTYTTTLMKNSFFESDSEGGAVLEKGLMSSISIRPYSGKSGAFRGVSCYDFFVEEAGEAGAPNNLTDLIAVTTPALSAGLKYRTGMITIFGTSGKLDKGAVDLATIHTNPESYNCLAIKNTFEVGLENTVCGFFHPSKWNSEGFYDKQGNSDQEALVEFSNKKLEKLRKLNRPEADVLRHMMEYCNTPSEAFVPESGNDFPTAELKARLSYLKANQVDEKTGFPVQLSLVDGVVKVESLIGKPHKPTIRSLYKVPKDTTGTTIMYEPYIEGSEKGLYKIGYDPVRHNQGTSLAAITVWKMKHVGSTYSNTIVAYYLGRFKTTDDIDREASLLARYYNTQIMHENEVTGTITYFKRHHLLHLLCQQPDDVISKSIKKSSVNRIYGCHARGMIDDFERYVKDLLVETYDYDEYGNPITTIDGINSIRFIEELLAYNRDGNFDMLSSFFMCVVQMKQDSLGKVYGEKRVSAASQYYEQFKNKRRGIQN